VKNTEHSSIHIKKLVYISTVFILITFLLMNFLPKDRIFSLAKTNNEYNNSSYIKENNEKLEIETSNNEIQIAEVTSRSGDELSRSEIQETEIVKEKVLIENVKISRDMDLTVRTGLTKEDFKILISRTKQDTTKFFYNNSDLIYDLCEKYQINEIFFCGLIAGESGWNIASNHRSTYNYISLMYNGKLKQYKSVEDGLEQAAKTLNKNYLTEGGSFYYGKTLSGVRTKFCPNSSTWVNLIYTCMNHMIVSK